MSNPNWNAKLYNDKHAFVWEKAKGLLDLLAPKPGEAILDLGCGTGHLTSEIAASGARVIGIDRSAEMIAEAKAKYPAIEFQVVDATQLQFSNQFDAVFSNAALHWILEPEKVVIGIARALKPGGRLVAEFGGKGNIRSLMRAINGAAEQFGIAEGLDKLGWYYPSIAEYAGLLEKPGLEVREASLFDRPTRLEDGEAGLDAWLRMFRSVVIERLPAERQPEYLREVARHARPELFKDGVWELDYRRLRIAAWKISAQQR
jgi:trans-aconitate methyltransferase